MLQNSRTIARRNGVTILEYALLLVVLVAVLMSMQIFLRRAISYKWREAGDSLGFGRQYAPEGAHRTTIVNH
ncbi:MAG: hypothetical protein ABIC68_00300 [Candidatus Omnitrophota bacterium]